MVRSDLEREIAGLAVLDEPARRALYFFVAERAGEVSREEAARAVGVSRGLAGFHLDRLAEEGLLETSFRRLTGRAGPGAGRPAKLYRRSARQLEVSLPPRRYELAARLLAAAVDGEEETGAAHERLAAAARETGARLAGEVRSAAGATAEEPALLEATLAVLAAHGYEPEVAEGEVRLRNCPFHALAHAHTRLVCGMNLALLEGFVAALDLPGARAELVPRPGLCCVALRLGGR